MRRIFALWRLYLQNSFGLTSLRHRLGQKKERSRFLIVLLLLPSLVGFLTMIYQFFAGIYETLPKGQEAAGLTLGFLFAVALVFIFGMIYLLSAFFFSRDTERLLPLPLKPGEIVGAKFASVLVNEYLTLLPLLVPAFIAWGKLFPDLFFWPRAFISFLLVPIVPLALASVVSLLIMRFVNLPQGRDFWRVAGILISLVVALGFQFFAMRMQRGITEQELVKLLLAPDGLMNLLGRKYQPALWATRFLAQGNLVALLELLLISAAALGLVLAVGERFFLGGVVGSGEVTKRKKEGQVVVAGPRGTFFALLWRETALFLRNPVFLTNGLLNLFFPPVIVFFLLRSNLNTLPVTIPLFYLELIAIGYLAALPVLTVLPATSISREGKQFWLSRLIPISPQVQVLAKLLWSCIATLLGGLLSLVVLGFLFKLSFMTLARALVIGFVGSIGVGALSILIDSLWPNLQWTDPQKAMKGNLTGLYAMLAGGLYLAGIALLTAKLIELWSPGAILALLLLIFLVGDLIFWWLLARRAPMLYWQEN